MVHDPILAPVGARRETRVPHAVRLRRRILIEHAPLGILAPVLHVHGVVADEFELAEAVVAVIGAGGAVDDKGLVGFGVGELFGAFVGGEADIEGAAVGGLFPGLVGNAENLAFGEVGGDGPGIVHCGGC